jgi:hypothetical protein
MAMGFLTDPDNLLHTGPTADWGSGLTCWLCGCAGDGFGAPLPEKRSSGFLTYEQALLQLRVQKGQHLTQIIMEFCDKGSLQTAINRVSMHSAQHSTAPPLPSNRCTCSWPTLRLPPARYHPFYPPLDCLLE